jgi:hypothetical protein
MDDKLIYQKAAAARTSAMRIEDAVRAINDVRQELADYNAVTLTDAMREYLRRPDVATAGFYDYVSGFAKAFELTPADTATLLAQWVRESV